MHRAKIVIEGDGLRIFSAFSRVFFLFLVVAVLVSFIFCCGARVDMRAVRVSLSHPINKTTRAHLHEHLHFSPHLRVHRVAAVRPLYGACFFCLFVLFSVRDLTSLSRHLNASYRLSFMCDTRQQADSNSGSDNPFFATPDREEHVLLLGLSMCRRTAVLTIFFLKLIPQSFGVVAQRCISCKKKRGKSLVGRRSSWASRALLCPFIAD